MANAISVQRIGDALGIVLPEPALKALGVGEGGKLFLLREPGAIKLVPYDEDFAEQIEAARKFMAENSDVLKKLAE